MEDPAVGGQVGLGPGKADAISEYAATFDPRVLTAPLTVHTERREQVELPTGASVVLLRSLQRDGALTYLLVDAERLETGLADGPSLLASSRSATDEETAAMPYVARLAAQRGLPLERLSAPATARGGTQIALTIDMCQSSRTWEARLFDHLTELAGELGEPVPVGIALTGLWGQRWSEQLDRLIAWRGAGLLALTWINHSYHHQLSRVGNSNSYLFLTDPSIDFVAEVLDLERLLVEKGEVPSLLFRFPGLTHNAARLGQLDGLGLFALDADAWLAKGQAPTDGSVILVHGNGNEPQGIDQFLDLARNDEDALRSGELVLTDPRDALDRSPLADDARDTQE